MAKNTKNAKTGKRRVKVKDMSASTKKLSAKDMKKVKGGTQNELSTDAKKNSKTSSGGAINWLVASPRDANLFS